jgi:hypothetical protein
VRRGLGIWLTCVAAAGCGRGGFDVLPGTGTDGGGGGSGGGDASDAVTVDTAPLAYEGVFADLAAGTPPSPRRSTGAAADPATGKIYVYGGYDSTFLAETYVYTPTANSWTKITPTGTSPGNRERHALAWDPVGNVLVSFGGQNRPAIQLVHYDTLHVMTPGGAWKQITKAGAWPAARKDAALIWIPHLSKFLLYGGDDGASAANRFSDTWLLSLDAAGGTATWTQLNPTGVIPAQSSACVVYDPDLHHVILFGGETADGVDNNSTLMFDLDNNKWLGLLPTGTPPIGESFNQCAWDPVAKRVVLFGGQADGGAPLGGAYTFDLDALAWETPTLRTLEPAACSDGGAIYSEALGAMFWFGGRPGSTTYTNKSWTFDIQ